MKDLISQVKKIDQKYRLQLSPEYIDFINIFYQNNDLRLTQQLLNIKPENLVNFYKDPRTNYIINILNKNKTKEIFKKKMMSLEELGSFLTNRILDTNTVEKDKFSTKDVLEASKVLIDIHKLINSYMEQPQMLNNYTVVQNQFDNLSVNEIKDLLGHIQKNNSSSKQLECSPMSQDENEKLVKEILSPPIVQYHKEMEEKIKILNSSNNSTK